VKLVVPRSSFVFFSTIFVVEAKYPPYPTDPEGDLNLKRLSSNAALISGATRRKSETYFSAPSIKGRA